jgi:hypothetical protein
MTPESQNSGASSLVNTFPRPQICTQGRNCWEWCFLFLKLFKEDHLVDSYGIGFNNYHNDLFILIEPQIAPGFLHLLSDFQQILHNYLCWTVLQLEL